MKRYIDFEKKKCQSLTLKVNPDTPFQNVLSRVEALQFVGSSISSEHIIYSVLELLNNSLRAHREKGIEKPILLVFKAGPDGFEISIQDWGGGFDTSRLPYELNSDLRLIDIHSPDFESYRQENDYKRFGLGLYLARKTFPYFSLSFFDSRNNVTDWSAGQVEGTCITLRTTEYDIDFQSDEDTEVLYEKQEII